MNIIIVSHMFPTPQRPAYGIFVLEQAKALSHRDHQVRVISPTPYVPDRVANLLNRTPSSTVPEKDAYGDVTVHYPRYWSLPRPETRSIVAFSFRRALQKNRDLFKSADLINAHVALPDGFGSIPVAREVDVPLVTTIHGADIYKTAKDWIARRQVQSVFDISDSIIMVSDRLLRDAKKKFTNISHATVVHNGIPAQRIKNISKQNHLHQFRDDRLVIATVSHLIPRKGHKTVIKAIANLSEKNRPNYLIIGDGPFRGELQEYVNRAGLSEHVYFSGYISDHRSVFANLKSADIMAMPSTDEAFGIAYLEAMACGLPVIACEREGPADFITHHETGFLVPPKDPDAIADVIREVQIDPDLLDNVANRGQQVALNRFTWERNAKSVERLFYSVLDD